MNYTKDIILSSNLSIHRNLEGYNFPAALSYEDSLEIIDIFKNIYGEELVLVEDVDETTLNELINANILSADREESQAQIGLVFKDDYTLVVNDQDHLVINASDFNLDLKEAFRKIRQIENRLDKKLDFAFSPEYGYLTSYAKDTGMGIDLVYKLFLFGLVNSDRNYLALKQTLGGENIIFDRAYPRYGSEPVEDVFILSNFGNYYQDFDHYLFNLESNLDTLVRNERRFRRDYQLLYQVADEDIEDSIKILEDNLKEGNYKSLGQILKALFALKKYRKLGFETDLDNEELDYLIFNINKDKYKGSRDEGRYEFLNSYMEERYGK